MSTKTIEQFFTGKTLVIPGYQRDYAWTKRNVDDLWGDVEEALEASGSHYLGTFILSQKDKSAHVHVVDGQQRLTTLTMLLVALIDTVDDDGIKQHYRNTFITHPVTGAKFRVLGDNEKFFSQLLNDESPVAVSDGQERLLKAHDDIKFKVNALFQHGGQEKIKRWLLCLSELEVLEFIEPNEGKAIRMFQSVNDRGVPLAKMDIVKSLLVYYSNRYLSGVLDEEVAQRFGQAYRSFSHIKRMAREDGYKVRHIDRDSFREDDVLRYHYFAFDGSAFGVAAGTDYSATAETVLNFLKEELSKLRNEPDNLKAFIGKYAADLAEFFTGLEALIEASRKDKALFLLFVVQDLAATLYPLVIRLHLMGYLQQVVGNGDQRCLRDLIEIADLRVFKLRGTNPQADVARITRELPESTVGDVAAALCEFCQHFMSDAQLASRLMDQEMYRNPGLQRILLEAEEQTRNAVKSRLLGLDDLVSFVKVGLTVEHILPQNPDFNIAAYGFADDDEFLLYKHRVGNLVLLEGPINSACLNRTVEHKMIEQNLYRSSDLVSVKALAASHAGQTGQTGQAGFRKADLNVRSKELAALVAHSWPIVASAPIAIQ